MKKTTKYILVLVKLFSSFFILSTGILIMLDKSSKATSMISIISFIAFLTSDFLIKFKGEDINA